MQAAYKLIVYIRVYVVIVVVIVIVIFKQGVCSAQADCMKYHIVTYWSALQPGHIY